MSTPARYRRRSTRSSCSADSAEYYLRDSNGRVAVYAGRRDKSPLSVTAIETAGLRSADRAMLRGGIPVADTQALLRLLEDLGS